MSTNNPLPHIMVFCVNYSSYDYLHTFMESVERAAAKANGLCRITLCVGDNTATDWQGIPENLTPHCTLKSFPYHLNIGYLGCALRMMAEVGWQEVSQASYCIISNVDLTLREDFFSVLATTEWPADTGWLAPDIFTERLNHHDNPFQTRRPRKRDFIRWQLLYSNHIIYKWLEKLYHLRGKHQNIPDKQTTIYAGHGSLMVISGQFLAKHPYLKFPTFMYGEELFFAELIYQDKLKTYYCPSLYVSNVGRVSTGKYNYKWLCRQNRKSLRILKGYCFRYPILKNSEY